MQVASARYNCDNPSQELKHVIGVVEHGRGDPDELPYTIILVEVYVKKEYSHDLQKGHGELIRRLDIVKSVMGKALYFETLLTDYGACFDKLPFICLERRLR